MRARGFTQDDGHIFCMEDQIECEVAKFMGEAFEIYKHFGFTEIEIKLALRPDNRIGEDAAWDKAEQALASALKSKNIEFEILPGEGAFYGPKIELHLKDSLGRRWQCGTMQVDFFMPGRLGAHYIDEHSTKQVPVMLHRATLGSMERFIGMLIESTAGRLPLWLAPVQVVVMGVSERHNEYTQDIETKLKKIGIRAKSDLRNEKIGYKIRELTLERVPYMVILGDQEVENKTISVRTLSGEDLGSLSLDAFNDHINEQLGE
jgi:threonyl-tRNA synthetase